MAKLVGIPGSLRKESFNRKLLINAADLLPDGSAMDVLSLAGIPLFNQDDEADGSPAAVEALKDAMAEADGIVIATPEYNGGMPGVLKNALDWASRPGSDQPRVLHNKPVALLGATPGGMGTAMAQAGWMPVLRSLRMSYWTAQGTFYVSGANNVFDEAGGIKDDDLKTRLGAYMAGFVSSIK